MNGDYYRVRFWKWNSEESEYYLDGISFETYREAKDKYDSMEVCKDTPQIELLKEEHDEFGCPIYEDQLEIKD